MLIHRIAQTALFATAVFTLPQNLGADEVTIMPLGDSITAGFNGPPTDDRGSYRHELGTLLDNAGYDIDFVGEFQRGPDDPDHQGLSGATIDRMVRDFGPALATFQPDYALILAGTNNHGNGPDDDYFVGQYRDLVNMVRDNSADTKIIFATVPKFGYDRNPPASFWTREYVDFRNNETFPSMNRAINQVAGEFDDISVVDYYAIFDIETDLVSDAVHPNRLGHQKLANLFFGELSSQFSAVPEPSSFALLGLATCAIVTRRRRRM
ncbi:MAG: GDSL-type esterase/lipase family protein [Planctomycetota bacterium]